MKIMNTILILLRKNLYFIFLLGLISNISNSSLEECKDALKEVAYSYYMRGKYIQYNFGKEGSFFSPEEATEQNINYMICTTIVSNIYRELLNITVGALILPYARKFLGNPEVVAYSYINNKNEPVLLIKSPNEKNYRNLTKNFSAKDIIESVEIGDIFTYSSHTMIIFDLIKDSKGKVVDAILMESSGGIGKSSANSKFARHIYTFEGGSYKPYLSSLRLNSKLNSKFEDGRIEGSLTLDLLSLKEHLININDTKKRQEEYTVLRIMQSDSKGNAILKVKTRFPKRPNDFLYNDTIELSDAIKDRLKFKRLYIEKTVDKKADNIVLLGDVLNYKITVINYSKNDYTHDLFIKEYIPEFTQFETHYESKDTISFKFNKNDKTLIWNIGKLKKDEKSTLNYLVKIINGKSGDKIESKGYVGNIPTSTIINTIGINLNKNQKESIIKSYEFLKKKYTGKKLINEIYKSGLNIDLKFDTFDITNLIINTQKNSTVISTIGLNKNNSFYEAILNKYWSTITSLKYTYIQGGEEVNIYDSKGFKEYGDPERREDFIYKETFQTGDILLYINRNDVIYSVKNNKLVAQYITYEEGEYAYIFIENKGFVGVNLGDDRKKNTKDDRNEFNSKYYTDNNLTVCLNPPENITDELLEIYNYQTLFGKDYYVILRPSLSFKIPNFNKSNIIVIISLTLIILFAGLGVYVFLKYKKMIKNGVEINFNNLKEELFYIK